MFDTFIFELNTQRGTFIAAKRGETGYYSTTVYHQDHADELNRRAGHSLAQVEAAEMCSMFNCWQNFDKITESFDKIKRITNAMDTKQSSLDELI